MASIELKYNYDNVSETKATIEVTAKDFSLPSNSTSATTKITHSNLKYQYKINDNNWNTSNSDQFTFSVYKDSILQKTVKVQCRVSYTQKVQSWIPPTETTQGHWNEGYTTTKYSDTEKQTVTIFFHPGIFSIGAISGQTNPNSSKSIIANVLTATKIDEWIEHLNNVYHWYIQDNDNYPNTNKYYSSEPNASNESRQGLKVKQNDVIYAEWFNNCMDAMRAVGHSISITQKVEVNDLIEASIINQLNFTGKS